MSTFRDEGRDRASGPAADTAGVTSGLLAGACVGGVAWGLVAAPIGVDIDAAHRRSLLTCGLGAAAAITLVCLFAAKVVWPPPDATPAMRRRQIAMALLTAPLGGWTFLFLQYLQQ